MCNNRNFVKNKCFLKVPVLRIPVKILTINHTKQLPHWDPLKVAGVLRCAITGTFEKQIFSKSYYYLKTDAKIWSLDRVLKYHSQIMKNEWVSFRRLNNIWLPKWNDFRKYFILKNLLNMHHRRTRFKTKLHQALCGFTPTHRTST